MLHISVKTLPIHTPICANIIKLYVLSRHALFTNLTCWVPPLAMWAPIGAGVANNMLPSNVAVVAVARAVVVYFVQSTFGHAPAVVVRFIVIFTIALLREYAPLLVLFANWTDSSEVMQQYHRQNKANKLACSTFPSFVKQLVSDVGNSLLL